MSGAPVDACASILFDEITGLFEDNCEQQDRDRQNTDTSQYRVRDFRMEGCEHRALDTATCHTNLHMKNGFGAINGCNVDVDSNMRITGPQSTNTRQRNQLVTRVAHAPPALHKGGLDAGRESALIHAETGRDRCAEAIPGRAFEPLTACVKASTRVQHVVPSWTPADSRAVMRDDGARACEFRRA